MDRKRIRLPWKTFYEYFLDSFILQRCIFHEFTYSFYYAWLDYIVLMAISLVTSIVLEWFKKLIRYEKFIDWVKRLVTKKEQQYIEKEKKSSIFWILIIFLYYFPFGSYGCRKHWMIGDGEVK